MDFRLPARVCVFWMVGRHGWHLPNVLCLVFANLDDCVWLVGLWGLFVLFYFNASLWTSSVIYPTTGLLSRKTASGIHHRAFSCREFCLLYSADSQRHPLPFFAAGFHRAVARKDWQMPVSALPRYQGTKFRVLTSKKIVVRSSNINFPTKGSNDLFGFFSQEPLHLVKPRDEL